MAAHMENTTTKSLVYVHASFIPNFHKPMHSFLCTTHYTQRLPNLLSVEVTVEALLYDLLVSLKIIINSFSCQNKIYKHFIGHAEFYIWTSLLKQTLCWGMELIQMFFSNNEYQNHPFPYT